MTALAIELSDAGVHAATTEGPDSPIVPVDGSAWPGFAWHDGRKYLFGREAQDSWFVHPRQVSNQFLAKLNHESTALNVAGRIPSCSELAYLFLRDYVQHLTARGIRSDKVVLAVPGSYLKDQTTEEEKVGLLLGIAGELKLPLVGIMDLSCAALCDSRGPGFNPSLPVVVVDVHLHGADLSLLGVEAQLARRDFLHLPQLGSLQLVKTLTSTMGNRFLRHTAFDIMADGRIEQTFFRETEEFMLGAPGEFRYQINTANRAYDFLAKYDQLVADAQTFAGSLSRNLQAFVHAGGLEPGSLTVGLTHRAAVVPGLEARLRADGFRRLVKFQTGAAACGAARAGAVRLPIMSDLTDVPVELAVPLSETRRAGRAPWHAQLHKIRTQDRRPEPTHAIINGMGHVLGGNGHFTIGSPLAGVNLPLPDTFNSPESCLVPLLREEGRLWYVDPVSTDHRGNGPEDPLRAQVEAGDRLTIRSGDASIDVLFAHCPGSSGARS